MPLPSSILNPEMAGPLIEQAALLSSIPVRAWYEASNVIRQGALDAAWLTISAQPGYNLIDVTGTQDVRLAVALEALVRLDLQGDAGSAVRSRLAGQGVQSVSLGSVSEALGSRPALHPATRALLAPYRGTVKMT